MSDALVRGGFSHIFIEQVNLLEYSLARLGAAQLKAMLSNGVLGLGYEGPDLVPARTREQALLAILDRKLSSYFSSVVCA